MKTSGKCSGAVKYGNNSKNEIICLNYRYVQLFVDSQDNIFISSLWTYTIKLLKMFKHGRRYIISHFSTKQDQIIF